MQSEGIDGFRKKIRCYKNPKIIGITEGEIISITPVTIRVLYGEEEFKYVKFKSLVDLSTLKKEDIGKKYVVQLTTDNQVLIVISEEAQVYNELYIETED